VQHRQVTATSDLSGEGSRRIARSRTANRARVTASALGEPHTHTHL
jgi:hypothetical protein